MQVIKLIVMIIVKIVSKLTAFFYEKMNIHYKYISI